MLYIQFITLDRIIIALFVCIPAASKSIIVMVLFVICGKRMIFRRYNITF